MKWFVAKNFKMFYTNQAMNRLVCDKKYLLNMIITNLAKFSLIMQIKFTFLVQNTLHTIVTNEDNIVQHSHIYNAFPKRMVNQGVIKC